MVREARHTWTTHHSASSRADSPTAPTRCRFDVERAPNEGWRIREQRDTEVVRQVVYGDWHRVELAIRGFSAEAWQLKQQGWRIVH